MCTAISENGRYHLFGRTLDLELSYSESICVTPRGFAFDFLYEGRVDWHSAIIGIAHLSDGIPLYYDGMNEHGLCVAALNFPGNAIYNKPKEGCVNIASFEFIPYVLSVCRNVSEVSSLILRMNITNDNFSEGLPSTPLHFIISDKNKSIVVEPFAGGLCEFDNPYGVLTNNPSFLYHTTNLSNYMGLKSTPPENYLCPSVPLSGYSRGMGAIGLPGDYSSASRFVRATFAKNHTSHEEDERGEVNRFFHIMDTVSVPRGCVKTDEGKDVFTVYTSCGNADTGRYYYTTYDDRTVRSLGFEDAILDGDKLNSKII